MSYKKPVSNEACVLLRFPNEKENGDDGNICIGYQQWLEIKDVKNIPKIINKKKLIKTMWPVNVALSEASKINKELKNAVWRSFAGYILDVGDWVTLRQKEKTLKTHGSEVTKSSRKYARQKGLSNSFIDPTVKSATKISKKRKQPINEGSDKEESQPKNQKKSVYDDLTDNDSETDDENKKELNKSDNSIRSSISSPMASSSPKDKNDGSEMEKSFIDSEYDSDKAEDANGSAVQKKNRNVRQEEGTSDDDQTEEGTQCQNCRLLENENKILVKKNSSLLKLLTSHQQFLQHNSDEILNAITALNDETAENTGEQEALTTKVKEILAAKVEVPENVLKKAESFNNIAECTEYLLRKIIPEEEIGTHSLSGKQPAVNKRSGIKECLPRIDVGKISRVRGEVLRIFLEKGGFKAQDIKSEASRRIRWVFHSLQNTEKMKTCLKGLYKDKN